MLISLTVGAAMGIGLVLGLQHVRDSINKSLISSQGGEIWGVYRQWVDAGRPSGPALRVFLKDLRKDKWEVLEKEITIEGLIYHTLFSDPSVRPDLKGTLYVTTNGAVIWEYGVEILFKKELP
jgi:hypothetical protein